MIGILGNYNDLKKYIINFTNLLYRTDTLIFLRLKNVSLVYKCEQLNNLPNMPEWATFKI